MKLATSTGDFYYYTGSQNESLRLIRAAGFRYADYNFGPDYRAKSGVYADNWEEHIEEVGRAADVVGAAGEDDAGARVCIGAIFVGGRVASSLTAARRRGQPPYAEPRTRGSPR